MGYYVLMKGLGIVIIIVIKLFLKFIGYIR